jgi:hypothetical protein
MTPQDLIEHLGTQKAIAEFFNCSASTVNEWFFNGFVPLGRQYEAQVKTAGKLQASPFRQRKK